MIIMIERFEIFDLYRSLNADIYVKMNELQENEFKIECKNAFDNVEEKMSKFFFAKYHIILLRKLKKS